MVFAVKLGHACEVLSRIFSARLGSVQPIAFRDLGSRLACLTLGLIYFVTAMTKGRNMGASIEAVSAAAPFFKGYAGVLLWALVGVELLLASLLVSGIWSRLAGLFSFAMSLCFLAWHIYLRASSSDPGCGCGVPARVASVLGETASGEILAVVVCILSVFITVASKYNKTGIERMKYETA